jgi:ribosomal-protein-alanine N-acetyltransferase
VTTDAKLDGLGAEDSRVFLRRLTAADAPEYTALSRASVDLQHPWIPTVGTPEAFEAFLAKGEKEDCEALLVCLRDGGRMVGGFNINNIVRGRLQGAAIGYSAFAGGEGKGYMSEGLGQVLQFSFERLLLHRVEANIQAENEPSKNLVRRHRFTFEGLSPAFLFIDGAWRDHERWALTSHTYGIADDVSPSTLPTR